MRYIKPLDYDTSDTLLAIDIGKQVQGTKLEPTERQLRRTGLTFFDTLFNNLIALDQYYDKYGMGDKRKRIAFIHDEAKQDRNNIARRARNASKRTKRYAIH